MIGCAAFWRRSSSGANGSASPVGQRERNLNEPPSAGVAENTYVVPYVVPDDVLQGTRLRCELGLQRSTKTEGKWKDDRLRRRTRAFTARVSG